MAKLLVVDDDPDEHVHLDTFLTKLVAPGWLVKEVARLLKR